jgi:hypothetical protein
MEHINYAIYGVAVAGNRFLYADSSGCNIISQRVVLKLLGQSDRPTTIAHGDGNCGAPYHPFVDDLRSDADLLVFGSALERGGGDRRHFATTQQSVQRVGAAGCPCPAIASSPGPLIPADVDGGRILAYGDLATLVLDRGGRVLESLPVAPAAAQLAGDEVVVLVRGQLRDYDAHDGTLFHSWPLPDVPSGRGCWLRCFEDKLVLQDAARGLAAYSLDGEVHLLRLADGVDKVFARAAVARFMNGRLVYAQGSRIRIVPPAQLPLRGF